MRIGIDASKILPPRDGVGNFTAELVGAMMRLDAPHEFLLYGLVLPSDLEAYADAFPHCPDNFQIRPAHHPEPSEIDLYHSLAFSFPPQYHGRSVFTCYDLTILTHAAFHTVENKVSCMIGTLRALYRGAHFIAISDATAKALREELGVADERISRVYSGRAEHFRPLSREVTEQHLKRFELDLPYVLSVGTQEPRKNLLRLLEAYAGLPEELRQHYPLVICGGSGWKHEETERYLKRPELAGVRRLGRVSDQELVALYSHATVFAFPSLAEGFGLPMVEALACGAPVITSNLSSLPEVAGDAARLVDPYRVESIRQALAELLTSPEERQRLSDLARQQAARFSWHEAAVQTLAVYDRVLDRGEDVQN